MSVNILVLQDELTDAFLPKREVLAEFSPEARQVIQSLFFFIVGMAYMQNLTGDSLQKIKEIIERADTDLKIQNQEPY